jgi:hypothetical protein
MEDQDEPRQRLFGQPVGSIDPRVGPPALCFLQVAFRWVLKVVPNTHMVLRRFGCIGGP